MLVEEQSKEKPSSNNSIETFIFFPFSGKSSSLITVVVESTPSKVILIESLITLPIGLVIIAVIIFNPVERVKASEEKELPETVPVNSY